ncbi:dna repair protein [Ophiostoma piceae UAMH 11346]|uniref:Non-structural maintenance of chromosomes element 1 homolog n=1 Tax=Ophiostoma piceae (strain UAMH 11346) TaxID=1262450 RepID=S3BLY9_OPHP1|nr:dna repair protein [Ophiostoma piceae UAMH 11346]
MPRSSRKRARSDAVGNAGGASQRRRHDDEGGLVETDIHDDSAMDQDRDQDQDDGAGPDEDMNDDENQRGVWKLPPGYNDSNRAFLQAFMAHGTLTFRQAQFLLAAILNVGKEQQLLEGTQAQDGPDPTELAPDDITLDDMREFVGMAQKALAPLDFDIRSATNEWVDMPDLDSAQAKISARVWALISTDHDPKAHLAVMFPPRKLAFVHRLLGALFDTYNTPRIEAMCVTEQQAVKLSRPPRSARPSMPADGAEGAATADANRDRGLKHSVVISLLQSLVRQGWLHKSVQGFYSLSTRALLELESYLVETFNDPSAAADAWQRIKRCAACRELITSGLRCATPTCMLRLHDYCETAYWRTQARAAAAAAAPMGQRRPKCPRCNAPWGKEEAEDGRSEGKLHFIGQRAITSTDEYRRKLRQGRASEGVDDLMRQLLPRAATGSGGARRGGEGSSAGPFQQASGSRRRQSEMNEEDEGEE